MGNVNEGHERDEGLSSASDSADDLSESPSMRSYDERDDGCRGEADLIDESGDLSVLSGTLNVNTSLDAILAESTRVEQAIEINSYQHPDICVDTTTMVNEPGMTSLTSNLSLPISESIIPPDFDLLGEESPFAEGEDVFLTPDLSASESKGENSVHLRQMRTSLSDSVSTRFTLVGDNSASEGTSGPLGTEDNGISGKRDSLPSDEDGTNELQMLTTLRNATDELTAKFGSTDFVLTSTTVTDPSLSLKIIECDKCGHVLSDGEKQNKTQPDQSERCTIEDKRVEEAPKEDVFLPTEEVMVNKEVDRVTNGIILKGQADNAGSNGQSLDFQVASSDAPGKTAPFILKKHIPPAASFSDPVANSEEPSQGGKSWDKGQESQPPSLENLAPLEGGTNDQELEAPCQNLYTNPGVTAEDSTLYPLPLVSHGISACTEGSNAIASSAASKTISSTIAIDSIADKGVEDSPEKTKLPVPSPVVPEGLLTQKKAPDVEPANILSDVPFLSAGVTLVTHTESTTADESTAKEESCITIKKDEKHAIAPQPPRHTPDRPNWAVAPEEPVSVPKAPAKTQRRKPSSRRGKKSGETAPKDGPPTSSTTNTIRSTITPSAGAIQLSPKSSDMKAPLLKSSGTKSPEATSPEVKAPVAKPTDTKVPDAKKAPKPILRLPDIGTYEKPETKATKVKPAVSFEAVPSRTPKTTTEGLSAPIQQTISSPKVDSVPSSRGEVMTMAQPPTSQAPASTKSMGSVEPPPARRGRSMSISAAQNSALPPNKRPASIVSSWRSGMALPVIPEGTTKTRQSEDGRKSFPAVQSSVATVDVSAKDKIAAILAESCQSNMFKYDAPKAQGNNGVTASTSPHLASITIPKDDVTFKQGKTRPPESPLAEGFQTNDHSLLAWRHGVTQPSPPVVVHNSSGATVTIRKAEDHKNDVAPSNSKGRAKAVKAKSKAKASQPPQEPATVNAGRNDLSLHVQECSEPVKVSLPQPTISQEPLRYHTPPRTVRPAFFSDVNAVASVTPLPASGPAHQHNIAFQTQGAAFSSHSSKVEYSANADMHPQMFMPQRAEGVSGQHSLRVEHPPQLRHYEFVPRNHTTSCPAGYPTGSIPIRGVDPTRDHPGPHPVQVPRTSHQPLATNPSFARQPDNQFLDGIDDFNGRAQPREFSSYQQQLYQNRQAEIMRQSQGLRHRASESSFTQSRVGVGHSVPESWNGSLMGRPVDHQNVPIYQTPRPPAPTTNFAARAHGPPSVAGQRMGRTFNNTVNQFPPHN